MAAQPTPVPVLDPEQAIRALAKEFETYYNARDIDKLVTCFTSDGRMMAPYSEMAQGPQALRLHIQQTLANFDPRKSLIETQHVEYSGDVAFGIGIHTQNIRMPDGKRRDDRGKWVTALRRERGQWKLVALCVNSDLPLPLAQ